MTQDEIQAAGHWADVWAAKTVREKGSKELYTCASGITPSGTVHIGNFREIISVDLVYKALLAAGKNARFIYSWDDYDVFRKVPKNMPKQELLARYLRKPIDSVPDVYGRWESYAQANEKALEEFLPLVGINPIYISQSKRYRAAAYAQGIRTALERADAARADLDAQRTEPLPASWLPVSIFCEQCEHDETDPLEWDGSWKVLYSCRHCGYKGWLNLQTTAAAKLPWRIDWPMRWAYEDVDFEPAGKDHHTQGGSFDTAKNIVADVYGGQAPVTFMYEFVSIKGGAGKISSSSGEVVDLKDCLEVYQPEVVRYLFAGTRPNASFSISFDLDVLKVYEDYDKCERGYYNKPADLSDPKKLKKWAANARVYDLSQVTAPEDEAPYQVQIRHLCNLLQIHSGDIDKTIAALNGVSPKQTGRLRARCQCAWNWITLHAPQEFRFALRDTEEPFPLSAQEKAVVRALRGLLPQMAVLTEDQFSEKVYAIAAEVGLDDTSLLFPAIYKALLGLEKGPRLISFLYAAGAGRLEAILAKF